MKRVTALWLFAILLALPHFSSAQNTNPTDAGATPLSANFDVWPEIVINDNTWHNYQVAGIGKDPGTGVEEFVVFGLDEESPCGFAKAVINQNGVAHSRTGGFISDEGTDFMSAWTCLNQTSLGFFCGVTGDESSGNFVVSGIVSDIAVFRPSPPPNTTVASMDYLVSENSYAMFQRFDRHGAPVSKWTHGRNVPAGNHENDPNYATGASQSRACNGAVLSNGNTVYALWDRSGGSPSDAFGLPGGNINLFSITNAAGNTFVANTQPAHGPDGGGNAINGQDQQGTDASSKGWWAHRSDGAGGTVSFYRNDGTRFAEVQGYASIWTGALLPGGVGSIQSGNREREVSAGGDFLYVATQYDDGSGVQHPAALQWQVDPVGGTATPLRVILADSDAPVAQSTNNNLISVSANDAGDVVIGWRAIPAEGNVGAPVARIFAPDGTPYTDSFFASGIADPTSDNAETALGILSSNASIKVGCSGGVACVSWISDNGVATAAGNNCCGNEKIPAVSTVARLFQFKASSEVGNWDLY